MARSTQRDRYDAAPRPVGQSLWLLTTVAIAAILLFAMGETLSMAEGAARPTGYSGQDLLDLAAPPVTYPAAPVVTYPAAPVAVPDPESSADSPAPDRGVVGQAVGPQASGDAALATISYPWRQLLPGWTITFLPERDGLYGLTLVPEKRIEIYVRDGQGTELLAHVIAHELGHAVDVSLNDGPDRRLWEASRGIDSEPWWPGSGTTDFSTGAGDFAESFAAWQVGNQSFRSKLAGTPTAEQIALLAGLAAG